MKKLNKDVVLITGASSGIGKATAELFAKEGYVVYGTSRFGQYERTGTDEAAFVMLPMTLQDEASVKAAVQYVLDKHGRIDILINAAGSGIAGAIEETTVEEAQAQFDVCFFGVVRVLGAVLPNMREAKRGTIVNIGSVAAFFPIPFQAMYSASKSALFSLSAALRLETKPYGIHVIQIEPGDNKTGFTKNRVLTEKTKNTAYGEPFRRALHEMIRSEVEGKNPVECAKVIFKSAIRKNPPARLRVDFLYKFLCKLGGILPWSVTEKVISSIYLSKAPPEDWTIDKSIKEK